jgi:hypothetical protein
MPEPLNRPLVKDMLDLRRGWIQTDVWFDMGFWARWGLAFRQARALRGGA